MTNVLSLFSGRAAYVVGWTLVNSIWQELLVLCVLALTLAVLRKRSANARYVAAYVALLAGVALPLLTLFSVAGSFRQNAGGFSLAAFSARADSSAARANDSLNTLGTVSPVLARVSGPLVSAMSRLSADIEPSLPLVSALWLAGVLVLSLRNTGGWLQTRRLATRGVSGLEDAWYDRLAEACARLGVTRPVRLLTSERVTVPLTTGVLKPVILLPAAVLTGLTLDEVEAVLAHELAHIRRHDYLLNLVQVAVVTLLFYHPAVWWISRRIREEREYCCDDLAATACGGKLLYARALAALQELPGTHARLAVAATEGSLYRRVRRILRATEPRANGLIPLAASLLLIVSAALTAQAAAPSVSTAQAELMGRVEDFFLHNYRDVTARKSIEWGEPVALPGGNKSIRYMFKATIWDKEQMIMNEVYTFDAQGGFVSVEKVAGYPQKETPPDVTTKEGAMALVEEFFKNNYRDVTARETIEWGEPTKLDNGNVAIRYTYKATIWDKEKMIISDVFTFDAQGGFVNVEKVPGYPQKETPPDVTTKEGAMALVEEFFKNNYRDISARETIEWGEPTKLDNGNVSIRYKCNVTIRGKEKHVMDQVFTFNPKGEFVSAEDAVKTPGEMVSPATSAPS